MGNVKAREGQWYADRSSHDRFCVIAVDEIAGMIDVRDLYGDIDEFDLDEWDAMSLEPCPAPREWAQGLEEIERDEDEGSTGESDVVSRHSATRAGRLAHHFKSSGTT